MGFKERQPLDENYQQYRNKKTILHSSEVTEITRTKQADPVKRSRANQRKLFEILIKNSGF